MPSTDTLHAAQFISNLISSTNLDADASRNAAKALGDLYAGGALTSLVPALPYLLRLKGKPYSLANYFPMEPMFDLSLPRSMIIVAGRQLSKSTSLAAQNILLSAIVPYFSSLYICPRYEQTRRFSTNYIRPMLLESPIGKRLISKNNDQSVLQRSFINESTMHFSYALLDCDRTRGIPADRVAYDEAQDIDISFIPVINETLSASPYGLRQYSGTPKTQDTPLEKYWKDSSQGEWVIRCEACNHDNICVSSQDLIDMIQPAGVSCSKCQKPVDPATGHWEHFFPERLQTFAGYHIPQVIMPMHYANRDKWSELYKAKNELPKPVFFNEKLGESCDSSISLVTRTDLMTASTLPHNNDPQQAVRRVDSYIGRTIGIDWGGGGMEEISYTTVAVVGFLPTGMHEVIYGEKFSATVSHEEEVRRILHYFKMFKCSVLAHDYGGSGAVRETLLLQAGFRMQQIFNAAYVSAKAADMVTAHKPTDTNGRWYYSVDKARSLVLLCQLIKNGLIKFPQFESWEHLAEDILALIEDKREMPRGSDIFLVTRRPTHSDDFAHSVNFACLSYWHTQRRYPNLAAKLGLKFTDTQIEYLGGHMSG